MKVKQFTGGELLANAYVVWEEKSKNCYLIDAGYNGKKISEFVLKNSLAPNGILFTHHHYDHITDGPLISELLDCDMYISEKDFPKAQKTLRCLQQKRADKGKKTEGLSSIDLRLKTFDEADTFFKNAFNFENGEDFCKMSATATDKLEIIETKGHTDGGVCFVSWENKIAFTGDTIFLTEIGITNLKDGSPEDMARSCRYLNEVFADDMMIYAGHGEVGTMKELRQNNIEFAEALKYGI